MDLLVIPGWWETSETSYIPCYHQPGFCPIPHLSPTHLYQDNDQIFVTNGVTRALLGYHAGADVAARVAVTTFFRKRLMDWSRAVPFGGASRSGVLDDLSGGSVLEFNVVMSLGEEGSEQRQSQLEFLGGCPGVDSRNPPQTGPSHLGRISSIRTHVWGDRSGCQDGLALLQLHPPGAQRRFDSC